MPAVVHRESKKTYSPLIFSGTLTHSNVDGTLVGGVDELTASIHINGWFAVGASLGDATLSFADVDYSMPIDLSGTIAGGRADLATDQGRKVYEKDSVRAFVLLPALSASLAGGSGMLVASGRLRLVGARVQICPGIYGDLSVAYGRWLGVGTVSTMDPFDTEATYNSTGSSIGFELSVGYIARWTEGK